MKKVIYVLLFLIFASMANAQWVQSSNGMGSIPNVFSLAAIGNNIFAGLGGPGTGTGVYISTNNGNSWSQTALNNKDVFSIAISGNNIYAGTNWGDVNRSTNNGTSWSSVNVVNEWVNAVAVNGNNVYAGTNNFGVYYSNNYGANWSPTTLNYQTVLSLLIVGNYVFAGTNGSGIFYTTNIAGGWTQTSLNNKEVKALGLLGSNIFAGTSSGIYISTNNGTSWNLTNSGSQTAFSFATSENNIFVGKFNGIYLSTNNGTTWINKNQGFSVNPAVRGLLIANNYVFAGTMDYYVWRRDYSEAIGIKNISTEIPDKYSLSQNYPNPFNPSTNVQFTISNVQFVTLKVYDMLGKEVATLVNEKLAPGTYEVDWNALQYPSGVYFYRLTAGDFSETKKMILIK